MLNFIKSWFFVKLKIKDHLPPHKKQQKKQKQNKDSSDLVQFYVDPVTKGHKCDQQLTFSE